jgi:hypothetical protein
VPDESKRKRRPIMDRNERAKQRYHRDLERRVMDSIQKGNALPVCDGCRKEVVESLGLKYEGENAPSPDCGGATETDELGIIHHFHNAECRIASRLEALTDEEETHIQ